jgi:hypothetical protein
MSKYNPFETTEETVNRHLVIGILVIAFILSVVLTFLVLHLERDHKIENTPNKELYGKAN